MKMGCRTGLVVAFGLVLQGVSARGQVVERERDVKVTGPRGRSIERSIVSERAPGMVDRQVTIQRPGGTFHSNTLVERAPAMVRPGGPHHGGFGPPVRGGFWGPPFRGREVIINNGGGPASWIAPLAVGGGLFGLGMFAGSALASPPPQPVYAAPPPPTTVVNIPPQPYGGGGGAPVQQGPTVVVDPVADAVARLQSHHANSRREGAYTLGRLRDPRSLPALVDRLRSDDNPDVRIAAASALGEIGDPRAAVYLERVTIYDKKQAVRDAAAIALTRMPREAAAPPTVTSTPAPYPPNATAPSNAYQQAGVPPEPQPIENVPPPPVPAVSGPGFSNNP